MQTSVPTQAYRPAGETCTKLQWALQILLTRSAFFMNSLSMEKSVLCIAIICSVLSAGCFGDGGLALRDVTGKVTRDGVPLQAVLVQFQPQEGRMSFGRTDERGVYSLRFTRDLKGALVGEHRVTLRVPENQPNEIPGYAEMGPDAQEMALRPRLVDVPQSRIVETKGVNNFDFEISVLQQ